MKIKKSKKNKSLWLKEADIEVGDLYFTTANQYRAVLAMKGDFLIYAPSSEGMAAIKADDNLPFEHAPTKKCQIATFAQKEYQAFDWQDSQAIKHRLTNAQLAQAIAQCNAKAVIDALLTE